MQISQAQLRCLATCPRLFQYRYLTPFGLQEGENLAANLSQNQGREFHRLLQQHFQGLDIQPLLAVQPILQTWFAQFENAPPPMIDGDRHSEHRRSVALEGFTLVGVYDLVIFGTGQAQIVDWKTYPQPPAQETLVNHWQTRLYCYLLAATSPYAPAQISMTYWFAQGEQGANSYTFRYNEAQHQQIQQTLGRQLQRLRQWLDDKAQGHDLPQVTKNLIPKHCYRCDFQQRCQRTPPQNALAPFLAVLEDPVVPP